MIVPKSTLHGIRSGSSSETTKNNVTQPSTVDEQQAIELFLQQRNEEAFCALFVAVYGRVRRYFLLRGVDQMTAEDLAQQVMLTVYQKAGEFQDHKLFQGWLFVITRNELFAARNGCDGRGWR